MQKAFKSRLASLGNSIRYFKRALERRRDQLGRMVGRTAHQKLLIAQELREITEMNDRLDRALGVL